MGPSDAASSSEPFVFGVIPRYLVSHGRVGGIMSDEAGPKVERLHCNGCGQDTKHEVIAEREQNGSEPVDMGY